MEIQIPLVGSSYQSRDLSLSAQVTKNYYPAVIPEGLSGAALMCWPGAKLFSAGNGASRGVTEWKGSVYSLEGTTLYKVLSDGARTTIGTIEGEGRAVFISGQGYVHIVTDGKVYRTNGIVLESVTYDDEISPKSGAYINGVYIYDDTEGSFRVTSIQDTTVLYSIGETVANPDDLLRVYEFRQNVYLMGQQSIEPWFYTGSGEPPFERISGGLSQVGIAGTYAVTSTRSAIYFLGHDRTCYRLEGYEPVQVSTPAINHAIENYEVVDDCFCFALKFEGQEFVIYSFPTEGKTWAYSETVNAWFELSSGLSGRHLANGYCFAYGKHLISDYQTGNVYHWDINTFTDNGEPILRERTIQPIFTGQNFPPNKPIFWNRLTLRLKSGVGLAVGQGQDPQVMMQFSDDGGQTWSIEYWRSAGLSGATEWVVEWDSLGCALERVYRFKVSDPVELNLYKLFADVEVGI